MGFPMAKADSFPCHTRCRSWPLKRWKHAETPVEKGLLLQSCQLSSHRILQSRFFGCRRCRWILRGLKKGELSPVRIGCGNGTPPIQPEILMISLQLSWVLFRDLNSWPTSLGGHFQTGSWKLPGADLYIILFIFGAAMNFAGGRVASFMSSRLA